MSTEAQRLISVSLTKIAQSRSQRGGVSLHKNLLVATVLQRARYIFMEEAYHMVHAHSPIQPRHQPQQTPPQDEYDEESFVALTPEEAGCETNPSEEPSSSQSHLQEFLPPSCERCCPEEDKENQLPPPYTPGDHPTYIDLDKEEKVLKERTNSAVSSSSPSTKCLKRRRVGEWETEEAVTSILPKRVKSAETDATDVFLDDSILHSDFEDDDDEDDDEDDDDDEVTGESSMEIDRITSLVSIFSFGGLGADGGIGKLTRSVSTPDLCSAQAKEGVVDSLQQRPFLAMTV